MTTIAYSVSAAPQYWTFNPVGQTKLTAVWRDANAGLFKTHIYFSSSIIPNIEYVLPLSPFFSLEMDTETEELIYNFGKTHVPGEISIIYFEE